MCYCLRGAALQVLSTRARKDVRVEDIKIKVCIFAFDCLYLNGEVLLQKPLTERRAALRSALAEKEGELLFATAKVSCTLPSRRRSLGFVGFCGSTKCFSSARCGSALRVGRP